MEKRKRLGLGDQHTLRDGPHLLPFAESSAVLEEPFQRKDHR
jgi:hypothetical protein